MIDVLLENDTREALTERKGCMRTQQEDGHLQAKEREAWKKSNLLSP